MSVTKQFKGIVVSHALWERSGYRTFEQYRLQLIEAVDQIIDLLHADNSYKSFTLDGQSSIVEDYLEIKPERRTELERLAASKRIIIGPWYVIPNEFLVSPEAIIRNLMLGMKLAKQFGCSSMEGYIPSTPAHIHQLPQLLHGFGLRSCIVDRGIGQEVEKLGTEFWWSAPDGSTVLTVYQRSNRPSPDKPVFAIETEGYRFEESDAFKTVENVRRVLETTLKTANTQYLLFNNRIDRCPPLPHLHELIAVCNSKYPHIRFTQGTFSDYIDAIVNTSTLSLRTHSGELTGTLDRPLLLSVYSARSYLKRANDESQKLLERYAEPLAAFCFLETKRDYTRFVWHGWKELLKNHAFNDISGCSIDDVHQDDMNRYHRVRRLGEEIVERALLELSNGINTSARSGKPLIVYNPLNWPRSEVVSLNILFRDDETSMETFRLVNDSGMDIPFVVVDRSNFYRMVIDKEEKVHSVAVEAYVENIPPVGYTTLFVEQGSPRKLEPSVTATRQSLENDLIKVKIQPNGSIHLFDKVHGTLYKDLNIFEDAEDTGDTFSYSWLKKSKIITTKNGRPIKNIVESSQLRATIAVHYTVRIPVSLNADRSARSEKTLPLQLTSYVSLSALSHRVDIRTEVDNGAKDHRLRVLFSPDIRAPKAYAAAHCDVLEREHASVEKPTSDVKFESYSTHHQREFVSIHDAEKGLTIANKGIHEYESVESKNGCTVALTLLRCVGHLSRNDCLSRPWQAGPLVQTEDAQCIGKYSFEYSLIPHHGNWIHAQSYRTAMNFTTPVHSMNVEPAQGQLPPVLSFLTLQPSTLILSAVKRSEDKSGIIVRLFNISPDSVEGAVTTHRRLQRADLMTLNEDFISAIHVLSQSSFTVTVGPKKIVSIKLTY